MDEEQAAYQSEQASYEAPDTTIETGGESRDTVTTQEEFDIIKYNKEEVKIPVSERQNYLQKGYNYDKVQQRATELEQQMETVRQQNSYLEKRARQEGFNDVNAYLQAIDAYEQQQQIEQESQRMGVDPDTYAQYFQPVNQELNQLRGIVDTYQASLAEQQKQAETQSKWGVLYNEFPNLLETAKSFNDGKEPEWFNDTMKGYVGRGYDPVDAYRLANHDTIARQKEQEVLARVTGRDARQILSSTDQPNNMQFDPSNMSDDQIRSISERVQRGERITF